VQLGQTLKVPAGLSVPEQYVVQSGDSLNAIASKYNPDCTTYCSGTLKPAGTFKV
jgi:hypothetical protein